MKHVFLLVVFFFSILTIQSQSYATYHPQVTPLDKYLKDFVRELKAQRPLNTYLSKLKSSSQLQLDSVVVTVGSGAMDSEHYHYDTQNRLTSIERLSDGFLWGTSTLEYDQNGNLMHFTTSGTEEGYLFYTPENKIDSTSLLSYFPTEFLWERKFTYDSIGRVYQSFDFYTDITNLFEFDGGVATYSYDAQGRLLVSDQVVFNPNIGDFEPTLRVEYNYINDDSYETRIHIYNTMTSSFDLILFILLEYKDERLSFALVNEYGDIPGEAIEVIREWRSYDANNLLDKITVEVEELGLITQTVEQFPEFEESGMRDNLIYPGGQISSILYEQLNYVSFEFVVGLKNIYDVMDAQLLTIDEDIKTPNTLAKRKQQFYWSMLTSTSNRIDNFEIDFYPNPVMDKLFIRPSASERLNYQIYSTQGILCKMDKIDSEIDVTELCVGHYILVIVNDRGEATCQYFTKQ